MPDRITTTVQRRTAVCEGCDFTVEHRGALGSAAIHHDATGHVIRVEVNDVVTYGDQASANAALEAAGQTTLAELEPTG